MAHMFLVIFIDFNQNQIILFHESCHFFLHALKLWNQIRNFFNKSILPKTSRGLSILFNFRNFYREQKKWLISFHNLYQICAYMLAISETIAEQQSWRSTLKGDEKGGKQL
ncbi:hypothetical protein ACJX0J_023498, partial [Zea mays]